MLIFYEHLLEFRVYLNGFFSADSLLTTIIELIPNRISKIISNEAFLTTVKHSLQRFLRGFHRGFLRVL